MHTPFFPAWRPRLAALGQRVHRLRQHSLLQLPNTIWKRIPGELTVRVLRFTLQVPGYRAKSVTLVTTLIHGKADWVK